MTPETRAGLNSTGTYFISARIPEASLLTTRYWVSSTSYSSRCQGPSGNEARRSCWPARIRPRS